MCFIVHAAFVSIKLMMMMMMIVTGNRPNNVHGKSIELLATNKKK